MQIAVSRRAMLSSSRRRAARAVVTCIIGVSGAVPLPGQTSSPLPRAAPVRSVLLAEAPSRLVLSGSVRDTNGTRIPYVTLRWADGSLVTNDSGAFEVRGLPDGVAKFSVRRIGFEPVDFQATLSAANPEDVVIQMRPIVLTITGVDVDADADPRGARLVRVGFYERRQQGRGMFFGPDEIEMRRPQALSDIIATVPGVSLVGRRRSHSLQYYSSSGCRMNIFLDGYEVRDLGDDVLNASDIKAIEVYNNLSSVPAQFVTWDPRRGYCGSVVVWTK